MKGMACAILAIIVFGAFSEPLLEVVEAGREKILINSAIHTAYRVARDDSIKDASIADLEAEIDEGIFVENYVNALEVALNARKKSIVGDKITLEPYDKQRFNDFVVELNIITGSEDDKAVTEVEVEVAMQYKFKTKHLKRMASSDGSISFDIKSEQNYKITVVN